MRFCDCFIDRLVFSDTAQEITLGFLSGVILVVWIPAAYFESYIGGYDSRVVTDGFKENYNDAFLFSHASFNFSTVQTFRYVKIMRK